MILKIFTIYDSKVEGYLQPFFCPTKGVAIRSFTEIVNDPSHQFAKYPGDYTLFELGSFDDSTAKMELYPTPQSLGVAVEFVKS